MGAAGNTGIRLTCSTIGLCLCACGEASEDAERRLVSPGRAAGAAGESARRAGHLVPTWRKQPLFQSSPVQSLSRKNG